jgi:hypothetical protein
LAATGFTAGFAAAVFVTEGLATVFGAAALGATFEAVAFDTVAFAAVLAVLFGIALLLFLEDLAAEALETFRVSLREVGARLLVALRLAAAAFFEVFETLFLRVFCDTACARNCHAPVGCFSREPGTKSYAWLDSASNVPNIAHFPEKSMIYAPFRPRGDRFRRYQRD